MKSMIGFSNNFNLQAVISLSLIINLRWFQKIYFAVLEEIYNNVVPHWSAVFKSLAIIQLHALSPLQKTLQIRDQFFLYMDPGGREIVLCGPVIVSADGSWRRKKAMRECSRFICNIWGFLREHHSLTDVLWKRVTPEAEFMNVQFRWGFWL